MSAIRTPGDRVVAVVVTFQPDLERLSALLDATLPQVEHVFIVDNGDGRRLQALLLGLQRTSLIALGGNRGIAAAQNAGVTRALEEGATELLLMDQDSVPAPDMVRALLEARSHGALQQGPIAAVGAASYGPHGVDGFVRIAVGRFSRVNPAATDGPVECDQLIASGCLVSARAWARIGPMDESLFIDKVDTDWCLRAHRLGYRLLGAPAAGLEHRLGQVRVRLWMGRWREMPVHAPSRYYYMLRNSALLRRRPHATWRWILAEWHFNLRLLVVVLIGGLAGSAARRAALAGVWDGWRGVTGPWRRHRS